MNGELIVLHPETHKGFQFQMSNIRSCFHLFTLLQNELIGSPEAGKLAGAPRPETLLQLSQPQKPIAANRADTSPIKATSTTADAVHDDQDEEITLEHPPVDQSVNQSVNQDVNQSVNQDEEITLKQRRPALVSDADDDPAEKITLRHRLITPATAPPTTEAANSTDTDEEYFNDQANFNFAQWPALRSDFTVSKSPIYSIGGQMSPGDIANFEGRHIILLGPPPGSRRWSAEFSRAGEQPWPQLSLTRQLPLDEVEHLLDKIARVVAAEPRWNFGRADDLISVPTSHQSVPTSHQSVPTSHLPTSHQKTSMQPQPVSQNLLDTTLGGLEPLPRCLVSMTILASIFGLLGGMLGVLRLLFATSVEEVVLTIITSSTFGAGLGVVIGFFGWLNWFVKYQPPQVIDTTKLQTGQRDQFPGMPAAPGDGTGIKSNESTSDPI